MIIIISFIINYFIFIVFDKCGCNWFIGNGLVLLDIIFVEVVDICRFEYVMVMVFIKVFYVVFELVIVLFFLIKLW